MKKRIVVIFMLAMLMTACGEAGSQSTAGQNEQPEQAQQTDQTQPIDQSQQTDPTLQENVLSAEPAEPTEGSMQVSQMESAESGQNRVEIYAYIEEVQDTSVLIRSDSDSFSGTFSVELPETIGTATTPQQGDLIRIMMQEQEGSPEYRSVRQATGEALRTIAIQDVLLKSAPEISLSEVSSDAPEQFGIMSGSYEWTVTGKDMQTVVACGMAPLDAESSEFMPVLSIPDDGSLQYATFCLNCVILPDEVTVLEWEGSAMGDTGAKPVCTTTIYEAPYLLELQKNRIYAIQAKWTVDRGFVGSGEYVFRTGE